MKRKLTDGKFVDPPKKKVKISLPSFPNAHSYSAPARNRWEEDFTNVSSTLRMKENWTNKVFDKSILKKWKKEIYDDELSFLWPRLKQELQWLAKQKKGKIEPSSVDNVWLSDGIIPDDLKNNFIEQVNLFSNGKEKDWHPWSNETVHDIIHPSMYCYVHGLTPILSEPNYSHMKSLKEFNEFIGTGKVKENPTLSDSFQLLNESKNYNINTNVSNIELDSDVEIDGNNYQEYEGKLRFEPKLIFRKRELNDPYGYNTEPFEMALNEDQDKLFSHISKLFLWIPSDITVSKEGKVTFDSYINGIHPFQYKQFYNEIGLILEYFIPLWNEVLSDIITYPHYSANRLPYIDDQYGVDAERLENDYKNDKGENLHDLNNIIRKAIDIKGHSLQVITKIVSIELTPEKPNYSGVWHIEGVPKENIIATGIYYYSQENINENYLQFREAIDDPNNPEPQYAMGFGYHDHMNRSLGKVETIQDRLLAFPNTMQHCVSDISLKDKSKPGHRKLLVFFLVNPNSTVLSTSKVPPTRKDWLNNEIERILSKKLPPELAEMITDKIPTNDLETAKKHREYLMLTRKYYIKHQNEKLFERQYSYCEH